MENPWYDFMKFGNATQNAYEYEHLYDGNASQFERDMSNYERKKK